MPITWNLTGIANSDEVCFAPAPEDIPRDGIKAGEPIMRPVTNALIWATMSTGIGQIKDAAEADAFYVRLRLFEQMTGALLHMPDAAAPGGFRDRMITRAEVHAHIGLKTNVFPRETDAKWLKRFYDSVSRDLLAASPLPAPEPAENEA